MQKLMKTSILLKSTKKGLLSLLKSDSQSEVEV